MRRSRLTTALYVTAALVVLVIGVTLAGCAIFGLGSEEPAGPGDIFTTSG